MNISSGIIFRTISPNKNFSFFIDGSISNTTGISKIGFSGDNGKFELFEFNSGNILDFNKKNIYSYNPNENFQISGNIGENYINYFINNTPICLYSHHIPNYYKFLYSSTTENTNLDTNIFIKSNKLPDYEISFLLPIEFGKTITGYIKNKEELGSSFKIFSGNFINQNFYNLSGIDTNFISGTRSGLITLRYSSNEDPANYFENENLLNSVNGTLNLITNFGNISQNINLPLQTLNIYLLDFVEIFTGVIGDDTLYNYELLIKSTINNNNIKVYLKNWSGHNNETVFGTFFGTTNLNGNINGFIYGDDYLTGLLTGAATASSLDIFGNQLSTNVSEFYSEPVFATGNINYFYNIFLTGGSGLGPLPPSLSILANGTGRLTGSNFIFIKKLINGSSSGILSGFYENIYQSGNGLINFYPYEQFFTGNFILDYSKLIWSGNTANLGQFPIYNIIYGITGFDNFIFQLNNNGIISLNELLTSKQATGNVLNTLLPFNTLSNLQNSGSVSSSINSIGSSGLFYPNNNSWYTFNNTTTGFIEFDFSNFNLVDKIPITHYEIDANLSSNFYPYIFSLEARNNLNDNFTILDQKTGENFYSSSRRIFNIQNNTFFNYVRLNIRSGQLWPHIQSQSLIYDLRLNRINFYKVEKNISGIFEEVFNNITGNTYINNNLTGFITTAFQSSIESEKAWNAFNINNTAKISGYNSGLYLNIEIPTTTKNNITGLYLQYENGYIPKTLSIFASKDNIIYRNIYKSSGVLNTINTGIINLNETGFKYFKFDYSMLDCYTKAISTNPNIPYNYKLVENSNFICGKINNFNSNYIRFLVPPGYTLDGITLANYESNINTRFAIQSGASFFNLNPSLASGNVNNNKTNINLLTGLEKTISAPLATGNYTIELRTTGTDFINYRIILLPQSSICNFSVQNAGFNYSGSSLNGIYVPSNRYFSDNTWNNFPYFEHITINKSGAVWWVNNTGWVLGAGRSTDLSPNSYIIYASSNQSVAPYTQNIWTPQIVGRPNPVLTPLC
jgi:hypothetical protein